MRISGFISLALLASFTAALPAKSPKPSPSPKPVPSPKPISSPKPSPSPKPPVKTTSTRPTPTVRITSTAKPASATKTSTRAVTTSVTATRTGTQTGTQTGTKTGFNVKCTDVSDAGLSRRAFPKVSGLTSCRNFPDEPTLIQWLISNGQVWLDALSGTETSPPPAPNDIAGFKQKYDISAVEGTFDEFVKNTKDDVKGALGVTGSTAFNLISVKTHEGQEPYAAAVSKDGKILINTFSYGNKDVGGKPQMAFEDIMTYVLAFNADPEGYASGAVDIPTAVKKIEFIYRYNIANQATTLAIQEAYTVHGWTGIIKKQQLQSVNMALPIAKGLLATDNGTLGPKLLGTNMASFRHGSVSGISVVQNPTAMILKLTHG